MKSTELKDDYSFSNELYGDKKPSLLYPILTKLFLPLLKPEKHYTSFELKWRKKINPVLRLIAPKYLSNPQIFERLEEEDGFSNLNKLPKEPVIWIANHAFKDDVAATIIAAKRNGFLLFGSLPQFFNTFDGVTLWLNGVVLINRKDRVSKKAAVTKAIEILKGGNDIIIFPEGVWNKSPNELILPLWAGVHRIANATGAKVIPVVHYCRDNNNELLNNPIHTVIAEAIDISELEQEEALRKLRDTMAGLQYVMMEKYGSSTRDEELKGATTSKEAWEISLEKRRNTVDRYDFSIETSAHYIPKWKKERTELLAQLKSIHANNVQAILTKKFYSEELKITEENDFQSRF